MDHPASKNRARRLFIDMRKVWQLYLLMALPFAYIILFKYVPMYGAQIAFKNFLAVKGIRGSEWIGFENFSRFVNSCEFWNIMWNSISLSLYQLLAGFPFPILLALSLNYVMNVRFKKAVQMVTYAPHFISTVVMVGIIFQVLDPRIGIINEVVKWFGFKPINWIGRAASPHFFGITDPVGNVVTAAALAELSEERMRIGFERMAREAATETAQRLERDLYKARR